jgi:hypothetical protein
MCICMWNICKHMYFLKEKKINFLYCFISLFPIDRHRIMTPTVHQHQPVVGRFSSYNINQQIRPKNYIQSMVWQCLWFSIPMIRWLKKQHLNYRRRRFLGISITDNRHLCRSKFVVRRIFGDCAQFCSYLSISATLQTE